MIRVKLILIVMLLGASGLSAKVWSQADRMTVKTGDMNIIELFGVLQKQTELKFVFNHEDVERYTARVDATDLTLGEVLDIVLAGKPLRYEITNNHVIISRTSGNVIQQPRHVTVSGTVRGENGALLSGVTVVAKGTGTGTATDARGRYSLTLEQPAGAVLVFSMIGMKTLEVPVEGNLTVNATMKEQRTSIEEVVVTGYYNITKESYTGATRTMTNEELRTAGNQNVLTSLKNLDPSFSMIQNNEAGSNPNVLPEFQIRGQSSLAGVREGYSNNPNMPLFVLDGFEVAAEKIFDMDIYRVESITILKDAAATAIYGSRAANGVVVVTSIAPKEGTLYVTYNIDMTFAAVDLTGYDLLNAREKLEFEKMIGMYDYSTKSNTIVELDKIYNERLRNVESGYDTYWLNKPVNSLAVSHKHSLRVDGGTDNFRYAIDASYDDNRGVMKESGRTREGIGMRFQYIYKNFNVTNDMSYGSTLARNSPYGSFSTYAGLNPYYRYEDGDGKYLSLLDDNADMANMDWRLYQYNPLYNTIFDCKDETRYDEFRNNLGLVWNILPELVLRGSVSITKQNNSATVFKPAKHTDFANWFGEAYERRGLYTSRHGESRNFETRLMMSYQKRLDKHVVTANSAMDIRDRSNGWEQVKAEGFPNDNLDDLGSALQYVTGAPSSSEEQRRLIGFFVALNYIYDSRYMIDLTGRMDASSEFGANNRWAPFWSVGAGWNLHNESFLENSMFINRFKLRATYGLTGSVDYDPYQSLTTYKYMNGTRYHYGQGTTMMALGNPDLGWQKVHEMNLGLDLDMWNNRVQITANYYVKTSKDVLTDVTLPPSLGFTSYMDNLGEIENRGFEVHLRVEPIKNVERRITLTLFGTAAHNKNVLKKLSDALQAYNERQDDYMSGTSDADGKRNRPRVRYIEGASINSIWANNSLGVDAVSGLEVFQAANGGTTTTWSTDNYVIGGCTDPKLMGTFGFNLQYRRLRLNTSFYYSMGGDIYNQTLVDKVQDADFRLNVDRRVLTDRWVEPGDISKYTGVSDDYGRTNADQLTRPTTRFIERNNYLELSSVNASYEIDSDFIKKAGLTQFRVAFYMNDVFRASTVRQERGISYPFARNFSLGIQARF